MDTKKQNKFTIFLKYFVLFFIIPATILFSPGIINTMPRQITPGLQDSVDGKGPTINSSGIFECGKFSRAAEYCTFKEFFVNEIFVVSVFVLMSSSLIRMIILTSLIIYFVILVKIILKKEISSHKKLWT